MRFTSPLLLLVLVWPALAQTADDDPAAKMSDSHIERVWHTHWGKYARRFVPFEDDLVACPTYEQLYPSSAGVTAAEVKRHTARKRVTNYGPVMHMIYDRKVTISDPEAQAVAMPLPAMAVGEYGYIQSAEIVEILGPKEMLVRDIWLVDPGYLRRLRDDIRRGTGRIDDSDQFRFRDDLIERQKDRTFQKVVRMVGWDTKDLAPKMRWLGPGKGGEGIQIAIVNEEPEGDTSRRSRFSRRATRTRMVAIPAERFAEPLLSEQAFLEMLEGRGFTKRSFASLVLTRKRENPEEADAQIVRDIEAKRLKTEDAQDDAPKEPRTK
jgi:hypothetical protein